MTPEPSKSPHDAILAHPTKISPSAVRMEAAGLRHLTDRGLLVCLEHRRGLIPTGIENHLRKQHRLKGVELRAALQQTESLRPLLATPGALPTVAHGTTNIPELETVTAYHCLLSGCNREREALSRSQASVQKHQSRVHNVNQHRAKGGRTRPQDSLQYYSIATVQVQSLLPQPYERFYIIKDAAVDPSQPAEHLLPTNTLARFDEDLQKAEEEDHAVYDCVPEHPTQAQLPPWISRTGISNHLSGLQRRGSRSLWAPSPTVSIAQCRLFFCC